MRPRDLAILNERRAELRREGRPIPRGLEPLSEETIAAIERDVAAGAPLVEAARGKVSFALHAIIEASEASGDPLGVVEVLVELTERDRARDQALRRAYVACLVSCTFALGLFGAFCEWLAPEWQRQVDRCGLAVSAVPLLLLEAASRVRSHPSSLVVPLAFAATLSPCVPQLVRLSRRSKTASLVRRVGRSLGVLMGMGVSLAVGVRLLRAFDAALRASVAFAGMASRLEAGASLGDALRAEPSLSPALSYSLAAAEESGTLPATLRALAPRETRLPRLVEAVVIVAVALPAIAMGLAIEQPFLNLFDFHHHDH